MNCNKYKISFLILLLQSGYVFANYEDDIGYTRLETELGAGIPDGSGVLVSHIEAPESYVGSIPVYLPDPADSQFAEKTFNNVTGLNAGSYSAHANGVGGIFYGVVSIANGINAIDVYEVNSWLQSDFLRFGSNLKPLTSSSRIMNHSWVGSLDSNTSDSDALKRIDWVIATDNSLQIVGTKNSAGINSNLLSSGYNVIAVGRTDGIHGTSTASVDSTYTSGRTRPEIVVPFTVTSNSTPTVAAVAALLVETGNSNPSLSMSSTTNRNGDTIYNAENSEALKASLLAGADRFTVNSVGVANITDYRVAPANQSDNGLDTRYGAGQLNVYNSYHIVAAGEQDSDEDDGTGNGNIGTYGFDYDPEFGGSNGSNVVASYYFSTVTPVILTTSLAWNIEIAGGNGQTFSGSATLYDLDLVLYDVTGSQTFVISSISQIDNTENIWTTLAAGRNYLLQVIPKTGQASFKWDYALAWQMASDLDSDGINDIQDNCPNTANTNQADLDTDNIGDACDSDIDGDGTPNTSDAFPFDPTEDTDTDGDNIGNNADTDDDNDGLSDIEEGPLGTNPLLYDTDGDGYGDGEEVTFGSDPLDINSLPIPPDGDINNDGTVNLIDVLIGQRILTGLIIPTPEQLAHGDVAPLVSGTPAPDSQFNAGDLTVLTRKAIGMISF